MSTSSLVVMFDVDDTLIDNDQMQAQLDQHLIEVLGVANQQRYRELFEESRKELGYADFLGAVEQLRLEIHDNPEVFHISEWLLNFPFDTLLYDNALAAVRHVQEFAKPAILSDGDAVYQPHKIARAGLHEVMGDSVMIFVHKEQELSIVERQFPADHYVMVDDKVRVLAAMKEQWGDRLTTVSVNQGHYAHDPEQKAQYREADLSLEGIGDLLELGRTDLS